MDIEDCARRLMPSVICSQLKATGLLRKLKATCRISVPRLSDRWRLRQPLHCEMELGCRQYLLVLASMGGITVGSGIFFTARTCLWTAASSILAKQSPAGF